MEILENPGKGQKEARRGQEEARRGHTEARRWPGRGQEKARRGQERHQKARNPEFGEKLLETQWRPESKKCSKKGPTTPGIQKLAKNS